MEIVVEIFRNSSHFWYNFLAKKKELLICLEYVFEKFLKTRFLENAIKLFENMFFYTNFDFFGQILYQQHAMEAVEASLLLRFLKCN